MRQLGMWLNNSKITESALAVYRKRLLASCPQHVVIDNMFNEEILEHVRAALQSPDCWKAQKHTYDALYVDSKLWRQASADQRFVQRDCWQCGVAKHNDQNVDVAAEFLRYLRSDAFMAVLSRIFQVGLTDKHVADPLVNTNYFRLGAGDFVKQHADDSPGRKVCMLLYLNKGWQADFGGDLMFLGGDDDPIRIPALYNRCILFDPVSKGSEHWVNALNTRYAKDYDYRYNVTSWYWSE